MRSCITRSRGAASASLSTPTTHSRPRVCPPPTELRSRGVRVLFVVQFAVQEGYLVYQAVEGSRFSVTVNSHHALSSTGARPSRPFRGTSLAITPPPLGPYRRHMPRVLGGSVGGRFLTGEVPMQSRSFPIKWTSAIRGCEQGVLCRGWRPGRRS